MNEKVLILIVDDDPKLVYLVREVLLATSYEVISASSGKRALELLALEQPDLVILDILLAGEMDGYETARRMREFSNVPIVMLTAKTRESDLIRGFEAGADDYIRKPFSTKELLMSLRAVLKRSGQLPPKPEQSEIVLGNLHIDLLLRTVRVGEHEVHLTRTEYNLLHELAIHPNQVLFHEQLLTKIWGPEYRDDIDYLRTYIHFLRKKLEPDPANPKLIMSETGVGYYLAVPEPASRQ